LVQVVVAVVCQALAAAVAAAEYPKSAMPFLPLALTL
jgi:hypothetical protein